MVRGLRVWVLMMLVIVLDMGWLEKEVACLFLLRMGFLELGLLMAHEMMGRLFVGCQLALLFLCLQ